MTHEEFILTIGGGALGGLLGAGLYAAGLGPWRRCYWLTRNHMRGVGLAVSVWAIATTWNVRRAATGWGSRRKDL